MPLIDSTGRYISYICTDLIEELKQDILEFGCDKAVYVWCKKYGDVTLYTNYDFILEEEPIAESELEEGEFLQIMTMGVLLDALERQNSIC